MIREALSQEELIKKGLNIIRKKMRADYLPFKCKERIKDILRINPSSADGWLKKGLKLKARQKFYDDIYCFERAILLNPHNAYAWYELSTSVYGFVDKNARLFMKIAKSINKEICKEAISAKGPWEVLIQAD